MAGGHLRESTGPGMPGPCRRALYFCLRNALPCCIIKALTNRRARHDCQCCRFCRVRVRAPFESQKTAIPRVLTDIQEDGNALQFDGAFKRYVKTEEFDEDKPNGYGKFKVFWLKRKK